MGCAVLAASIRRAVLRSASSRYRGAGEVMQVEDYISTATYQTHQWSGYTERQVVEMQRMTIA